MQIYVDLDNTLTDFSEKLSHILHKTIKKDYNFGGDPKIWGAINRAGKNFWAHMEWMPDGHKLWDAIKEYEPTILTAPSNHPSSREGKKEWLKENLPDVPFIIEQKKEKYAGKNKVLIDDRKKNIEKWEEAGGIGILHKDTESTLEKLKKVLEISKKASDQDKTDRAKKIWIDKSRKPGRPEKIINTPPEAGGPYSRQTKHKRPWQTYVEASEKLRKIASVLNNM